ncbi:MAG: hypothetical protein ABR907_08655 [Terracidiphilus sp.]|jgi:hypothetical protein
MSKINKIGLAILFLVFISGICFVFKDGNLAALHSAAAEPNSLTGRIILGEESDSEINARINRLSQLREMYETTQDEDLKANLKPMILADANNIPDAKISADMRRFLDGLRKER